MSITNHANNRNFYVVQHTDDLNIFKSLPGNRAVSKQRAGKIVASIKSIGWIPNPIIVNEKCEVIDGAGRLEAARILEIGIDYLVIPGLTVKHCVAMNINQTNWNMMDFIKSYADQGDKSYKMLWTLCEMHPDIRYQTIIAALRDNVEYVNNDSIKAGSFTCTKEDFDKVDTICVWLESMVDSLNRIGGNIDKFTQALVFAYVHTNADKDRLATVINENSGRFEKPVDTKNALSQIEEIYNYKQRKNERIYFGSEYIKYLDTRPNAAMNRAKAKKHEGRQLGMGV